MKIIKTSNIIYSKQHINTQYSRSYHSKYSNSNAITSKTRSLSQSQNPQVDLQVDETPLLPQRIATLLGFEPTHLHFLTEKLFFKINFFLESEHW